MKSNSLIRFLCIALLLSCGCTAITISGEGRLKERLKSTIVAEDVISKLDVTYLDGSSPFHKLDIYLPAKKKNPLTVLVHIHGGGWRMGDKKMMKDAGVFYASRGFLFITPNYRLSPKVMHPVHVEDCTAALAWVFRHVSALGGDSNKIYLSGHSAGAHLAALLATKQEYLQEHKIHPRDLAGVIPVDTASFDLLSDNNERLVQRLVRQAFGSNKQVLRDASPFHCVTESTTYPDFLILNTTNRPSAVKGARVFADKLKHSKSNVKFVPVDDHTHKEMATGMSDATDPVGNAILRFLQE